MNPVFPASGAADLSGARTGEAVPLTYDRLKVGALYAHKRCFVQRRVETIRGKRIAAGEGGNVLSGPVSAFALPFQIGVAERGFAKPFVKIFKVGSHPLVDDYPINYELLLFIQS